MGYTVLRLFLASKRIELTASKEEKYEFIVNVATGLMSFEEIVKWIEINTSS